MTDLEKAKLLTWSVSLIRTREHQWLQYKNGVLDKETWEAYLTGLSPNFSYPRTRYLWEQMYATQTFDPEFSEVVNDYLADIPIVEEHILHTLIPE